MILKCNADSVNITKDFDGNINLNFTVSKENRFAVRTVINELKGKKLTLSVDKYRNSRSLRQNNLLWVLLETMGRAQGQTAWECYLEMLEETGAKFEYIQCLKEALPTLKDAFRTILEVEERGKTVVCKCFTGSSKFDCEEMKRLIDKCFDRLAELGVDAKEQAEIGYIWGEWTREQLAKRKKYLEE